MKFKSFLMKAMPYVLSVLGGIAVYIVSVDIISDADLDSLLSNVAASLLAIPLIFILYEYVNYKMSSSLNEKMAESLTFDVNSVVLKILKVLRDMIEKNQPLSWDTIKRMLHSKAKEIRAKSKITDAQIADLKDYKKTLNDMSYKLVRSGILAESQVRNVIAITKELAHVVNEWEYKGNTTQISKYIESLLDAIEDWFDSCERTALQSHQQFQLTIDQEAQIPIKKSKTKV